MASPINADNLWNPRAGKQSIYWTELGLILAVITCINDADMAAYHLEGTALDKAISNLIGLLVMGQPANSPYRLVDRELANWLNVQFPGLPDGRVEVDYLLLTHTVQVDTGGDGVIRVSVTLLQLKAMMAGYKVTARVAEGPDVGKLIEVEPFPPEFVAWCRAHPDRCNKLTNLLVLPTPQEVLNIVKQEGQQATSGQAPAKLAKLDPPSEARLPIKLPEIQKGIVTTSHRLCTRPEEAFGCGGLAPAPRPGQEPPPLALPTTGMLTGTVQQDRVEVTLSAGLATRMTINGQPVTGTYAVTDSAGRSIYLVVADGNVQMTYIPQNDMAIHTNQFGWTAMWTDANGRTWKAKARATSNGAGGYFIEV